MRKERDEFMAWVNAYSLSTETESVWYVLTKDGMYWAIPDCCLDFEVGHVRRVVTPDSDRPYE